MHGEGAMVCTSCGAPMLHRGCKVRCPRCGYFEDCSDTGLPAYTVPAPQGGPETEGGSQRSLPQGPPRPAPPS